MIKRILIGTIEDEIMMAVMEGDRLVELHLEEMDNESITGNIFLGKVENPVSSLDASFVNIGKSKNAFLRNKDLVKGIRKLKKKESSDVFLEKGDKIIVQVKKDPIGSKGPQVTTNIGIAGRYLVYMPYSSNIGVSKKIENQTERRRLHDFMSELINDDGVIIRTVAKNIDLQVLKEEFEMLKVKWGEIFKNFQRFKKPRELYTESDILEHIMREKYDSTVDEIITNSRELYGRLEKILNNFEKKTVKGKLRLWNEDIFEAYRVNSQLEDLYRRTIDLECGGSLVIDRTEAFTIIDINSGSNVTKSKSRDMALETNVQAAKEVVRQVRLRNLSGIIIVDFIDMEEENDNLTVLKVLDEEFKKDKAKTAIMGFTKLGLVEMTRKRTSPPLEELLFEDCPVCKGDGLVLAPKRILKMISTEMNSASDMSDIVEIDLNVHWSLSGFMSKEWREDMESISNKKINIDFTRKDPNGYDIKFRK